MKLRFLIVFAVLMAMMSTATGADGKYTLRVNKTTNCVTVYENNVPIKAMACSVGLNNATPSGTFYTKAKYEWKSLNGGVWGQYSTRITGSYLFHSVYYTSKNKGALKTSAYNKLGTVASAGCVRLTVADAKWIYDNCPVGTKVVITNDKADPLPKPEAMKLTANATYKGWDPTDPDPNNPWKKEFVKIKGATVKRIYAKDALTGDEMGKVLREGVTAYDLANNIIHFDIGCNVSTVTPGTYDIKYFATDCLGNYGEAYTQLIVE